MAKGCPDIYAQDLLPTFELTIDQTELDALEAEFLAQDDTKGEHPVALFKYGTTEITDATARLRGNPTWWPDLGKMQFEVSFNTFDKTHRFMGQKHLLFDAASKNRSFLRDRLAMTILQDVGIPAPCANNARLVLNGSYYGLFTSIEKVDSEMLERLFENPDGNLYKRASWEKKTNEEDPDRSDIDKLQAVTTLDELVAVMNLEEASLEWAAEAVMPDGDGPWAGGLNQYLYNDPKTGFNVIPWDMDATFTRLPYDTDPIVYLKPNDWGRPWYDIALKDPDWFKKYIAKIDLVLKNGYKVDVLQARMDTWAEQIATAADDDPNKPFTTQDHLDSVKYQRDFIADRAAFLTTWLGCWQSGGSDTDGDGICDPP